MDNTRHYLEVDKIISKYPKKESAVMPVIRYFQQNVKKNIDRDILYEISEYMKIPINHVFATASYYTMYGIEKDWGKYHIEVDTNIPSMLSGAYDILDKLSELLNCKVGSKTDDGMFSLSEVEDLAACGTAPVLTVNGKYYENMSVEKVVQLVDALKNDVVPDISSEKIVGTECSVLAKRMNGYSPASLIDYLADGGYKGLEKAHNMECKDIIEVINDSGLRGRGGAGYPAGMKMHFIPRNGDTIYVVANADEGEPGTFKDRYLMEYDPHIVIEGIAIAARAINAKHCFIYLRGEFSHITPILQDAIKDATAYLNGLKITIHEGGGSYMCGEETAMLESLEGRRGQPRIKPPYPAFSGLYGKPTLINNIETLASLPFILREGANEFKKYGRENNYGFKLYGVSGHVNRTGMFEFPLGISFEKLMETCGGVKGGKLKGIIPGGLSTTVLTAKECEGLILDYDGLKERGSSLGTAGVMVFNEHTSIPQLALRTAKFYAHESCGKCFPCTYGSELLVKILEKIISGKGRKKDIENALRITETTPGLSLCPTGEAFSLPVGSMIKKFRDEFDCLVK